MSSCFFLYVSSVVWNDIPYQTVSFVFVLLFMSNFSVQGYPKGGLHAALKLLFVYNYHLMM